MPPKLLLTVVIAFLLIANCYVLFSYDLEISRWARLLSTGLIFAILLWQKSYDKRILGVFSLLLISDCLLFYYENTWMNAITLLVRISAYILMAFVVGPELKNLQTSVFQKILFVIVLGLNLWMLYFLVDMVPEKFYYDHLDKLFYIYGISMILAVIMAISYSNRYANKTSFFYTAAILAMVFSDISSFIAYYLEFDEFFFADRIFYLLSIAAMVKFATFSRNHKAVPELESL